MKHMMILTPFFVGLIATAFLASDVRAAQRPGAQPTSQPASAAETDDPVVIFTRASGLRPDPAIRSVPGGEIDWTAGVVYAIGSARAKPGVAKPRAMAQRGAYLVAARNASLLLAGIPVGPGGRFRNIRDGRIRADVTLKNFRELPGQYDPATRRATARLEIPIYGVTGLVEVLDLTGQGPAASGPSLRRHLPATAPAAREVIVIDARGLKFSPALLPKLLTPDGRGVVFDAGNLPQASRYRPAVRYVVLPQRATWPGDVTRRYRGGAYRCVTLRPGRALAGQSSTLVLTPRDLDILAKCPNAQSLLSQGLVVIIVDRRQAK